METEKGKLQLIYEEGYENGWNEGYNAAVYFMTSNPCARERQRKGLHRRKIA